MSHRSLRDSEFIRVPIKEVQPEGKTRPNFSPKQNRILREWFNTNITNPYPSITEKKNLATIAGLKYKQIQYWFVNARSRSQKVVNDVVVYKPFNLELTPRQKKVRRKAVAKARAVEVKSSTPPVETGAILVNMELPQSAEEIDVSIYFV